MNIVPRTRESSRAARVVALVLVLGLVAGACGDSTNESSGSTTTTAADTKEYGAAPEGSRAPEPASLSADAGEGSDAGGDENIIGGQTIDIAAVPWTAALVRAGVEPASQAQFCGGVLVLPTVVMTAAHCVTTPTGAGPIELAEIKDPGTIEVVLGRTDLDESGGERIDVSSVWVSTRASARDAESYVFSGDYALLELAEPSDQNPVALPSFFDVDLWAPGTPAFDVGWGCTRANTPQGEACVPAGGTPLQIAQLELQADDVCTAGFGAGFDAGTGLCVVDAQQAQSACNGDSGGPLIVQGPDERWYVVGLNSWGVQGCQPGVPAVAAFVPLLMDPAEESWIDPNELFVVNDGSG